MQRGNIQKCLDEIAARGKELDRALGRDKPKEPAENSVYLWTDDGKRYNGNILDFGKPPRPAKHLVEIIKSQDQNAFNHFEDFWNHLTSQEKLDFAPNGGYTYRKILEIARSVGSYPAFVQEGQAQYEVKSDVPDWSITHRVV